MIALLMLLAHAEEVDPVELAALLLRDGHAERAAATLAEIDPDDPPEDLARWQTVRGLVATETGDHATAAAAFREALTAGASEPVITVYLGRELLALDQPAEALAVLTAEELAATWVLRARSLRALDRNDAAYDALIGGSERFADDPVLLRERALFLAEHGLVRPLEELQPAVLATGRVDDALAIAAALRPIDPRATALWLEALRLQQDDPRIPVHLAAAWIAAGEPRAAGQVLLVAAEADPSLFVAAARAFEEAGDIDRALYANQRVVEPRDKARQRLGLLVAAARYDEALALLPRLERLGLLSEDRVAYAVAYAHFQIGERRAASMRLDGIADAEVFRLATGLRQAIAACEEAPWSCR